ncbi:histidine phosphatase family protein [Streptomyces sp. SL13]|uniref:Histidine phosphatase family protein n=1 Tax=Streptantibioticus silvisoli TaxID=2705255 RepID=A0AA90H2G9_9ACTN|nr:histidine phosphatase family protein [Streptantibioticus silvisoli]MDI5966612.1 histidine phosphatase family protein [Streptantibioticus silvisoli]MDI5970836.1 histidine phosphatase family protein [Streptantibioticus silvisoli]
MTTLHLVRHGQSEWNLAGRLQGQAPGIPLTGLGHEQAAAAALSLDGVPAVALYSSDLLRARQTASPVAERLGLPVRVDARLREQGHGQLEGFPTRQLLEAAPYDFADPDAHAPGGESTRDVHRRMAAVLTDCLERHRGRHVVLVGHGDAIRAGLAWLNGHPADRIPWLTVPNGSVHVFRTGPE